MAKTILIIEDNADINNMLRILLGQNGYRTVCAYSGTEGLLVHGKEISLILLDLMLPGKSGEEIIKELKAKHDVPVIVISAICDINKKVDLFALGADDYVTKPFHNEELLARIEARLRDKDRGAVEGAGSDALVATFHEKIVCADISLDLDSFTAVCNGKAAELSRHEFELLALLMKNENRVCTKSMIYDNVWNDENSADDNTLNVHISKIRKKLKQCNESADYIETVWGIGYRFKSGS